MPSAGRNEGFGKLTQFFKYRFLHLLRITFSLPDSMSKVSFIYGLFYVAVSSSDHHI